MDQVRKCTLGLAFLAERAGKSEHSCILVELRPGVAPVRNELQFQGIKQRYLHLVFQLELGPHSLNIVHQTCTQIDLSLGLRFEFIEQNRCCSDFGSFRR